MWKYSKIEYEQKKSNCISKGYYNLIQEKNREHIQVNTVLYLNWKDKNKKQTNHNLYVEGLLFVVLSVCQFWYFVWILLLFAMCEFTFVWLGKLIHVLLKFRAFTMGWRR